MKKSYLIELACVIILLFGVVGISNAAIINYEELSESAEILDALGLDGSNYHGLSWSGSNISGVPYSWVVSEEGSKWFNNMGDLTHSGDTYAWSNAGSDLYISSDRHQFDLMGFWARLPYYDNYVPSLDVTGFQNGLEIYSETFSLYDSYTFYDLDFIGIDRLVISAEGRNILIDDITYKINPVPEPTTFLLLGTGIISLAGFRKKIKKI